MVVSLIYQIFAYLLRWYTSHYFDSLPCLSLFYVPVSCIYFIFSFCQNRKIDEVWGGKECRNLVSLGFRRKKRIVKMPGFTDMRRVILNFGPFTSMCIHRCKQKKLGAECPIVVQHALMVEAVIIRTMVL